MQAIAGRFVQTVDTFVDLATGEAVTLRHLPPCDGADERRWVDACARLLRLWHEDMPPFPDCGFTAEGRFEAYGSLAVPRAREAGKERSAALLAFLDPSAARAPGARRGPLRIGMRLAAPTALMPLLEILEDGRAGCPVSIACVADPGAGATTFLRMAAAEGRRRGFIPLSVRALERWPALASTLRDRSVMLLGDAQVSARQGQRWLLQLGSSSPHGHVLLQIDRHGGAAWDVVLHLAPIDPDVLVSNVHVFPEARLPRSRVRLAAVQSGGLPGKFVACLREPARRPRPILLVAEARPAYVVSPDPPIREEVEHPWRDLIADAVRLAERGRRAAAERDLRQIAAAAKRRQLPLPSAAAEIELGTLLLARGRTAEAREAFTASADLTREHEPLSARAVLGLGAAHLALGELEAAESAYRVCRPIAAVPAAVGLAETLCTQGRYADAERAIAHAQEAPDPRQRAAVLAVAAAVAIGQENLPAAARAAGQALALADTDRGTEAAAAELLTAVHGRIGDREAVERYGRRALAAARSAGASLLAIRVRATLLEARHACGTTCSRRDLERLLRVSDRVPALYRARLWAVASRVHPAEDRRAEYAERLTSFVKASGARAMLQASAGPEGEVVALDVASLVAIHEAAPTPAEGVRRIADWVRERVRARAVVVCDANGALVARSGAQDTIAAARRVLLTRVGQPPWASSEGLEAAALVRYAAAVQGVLACRWPLSRTADARILPLLATAASVLGPAMSALAERASAAAPAPDGMIGRSAAIQRVRDVVCRAGPAPFAVLIEGESGSGKELVARAIHHESPRRLRPCVAINCAAVADDLFEAEVFGHARGAFTGAHVERAGLFEQADGGTLFLDEVSELSPRAQAKLLRTLQEGEVRRIGENHPRRVDVRVIAASNRRLGEDADAGRFRRDLLFRLAVVRIAVPPLRERREDIPLLAAHYWDLAARRAAARSVLTAPAVARLVRHDWPGNVRELQNVMAALAVQVPRGRVRAEHVSSLIGAEGPAGGSPVENAGVSLAQARQTFDRQFVAAALARCGGRHAAAARELGVSRQGLAKLLRRLTIT